MAKNVRSWTAGGKGFIEARFRADDGGLREAREAEAKIRPDGFTVIDVHQVGGHLDVGRSIASSLVGLSLLKATGFGFVHASHDPGEIVVTFEKTGLSPDEVKDEERLKATAHRAVPAALVGHPELQHTEAGAPRWRAVILRNEPMSGGATFFVQVANDDAHDWRAYELEAVVYRPRDGRTIKSFTTRVSVGLKSGHQMVNEVPVTGLPAGDIGVLVGVTRVLVGKEWTS